MGSEGLFTKVFAANTDEALINAVNNGLDFEICEDEPYGINFYSAALSRWSPTRIILFSPCTIGISKSIGRARAASSTITVS